VLAPAGGATVDADGGRARVRVPEPGRYTLTSGAQPSGRRVLNSNNIGMTDEFRVSPASAAEIRTVLAWAAEEGWNPGIGDAAAFFPADPCGFLIGRRNGEPVTSISVIRYGAGFGFLGLYIAHPSVRGRGYGLHTWRAGMRRLDGRNVGLDGVAAQQDNYRRSGFRFAGTTVRYQGVPAGAEPHPDVTLIDAREVGFGDLAAYDRRFFPAARDAFLAGWITLPGHRALVAVRDGTPAGFGVLRPARDAARIGPLYAASPEVADTLLAGLTAGAESEPVVIDVPGANLAAVAAVESFGLKPQWETARMYTGPVPDVDLPGIYAVTTLELG
jgi:hypothetical protein